jgi:hypothetical protein
VGAERAVQRSKLPARANALWERGAGPASPRAGVPPGGAEGSSPMAADPDHEFVIPDNDFFGLGPAEYAGEVYQQGLVKAEVGQQLPLSLHLSVVVCLL